MTDVYTCKWGILACGSIAKTFTKDLLADASKRDATDIHHKVVAVSSSTSVSKAEQFKKDTSCPNDTKTYGSYEDLVKDPDVQIIYVASPHPFHYENVLLCLENGKNVCCEKPFTINAKQTAHLIKVAREKNLFMMEAVWTRFIPAVLEIQRLIHKEKILGRITRVFSDLSFVFDKDPSHRAFAPELGGGALLDIGIYALTWQLLTLYQHPENKGDFPSIVSTMLKTPLTGVDNSTTIIGNYEKLGAQGIATCSMDAKTNSSYAVLIQGEKGDIRVSPLTMNPSKFTIELKDQQPVEKHFPIPGHGMFYEADAAARALRDGKKEVDLCRLEEDSLVAMKIMDQVREAGNFKYPSPCEDVRSDA
ncbi:unnamed protein product [Sympodiomycopsis kandeliae]